MRGRHAEHAVRTAALLRKFVPFKGHWRSGRRTSAWRQDTHRIPEPSQFSPEHCFERSSSELGKSSSGSSEPGARSSSSYSWLVQSTTALSSSLSQTGGNSSTGVGSSIVDMTGRGKGRGSARPSTWRVPSAGAVGRNAVSPSLNLVNWVLLRLVSPSRPTASPTTTIPKRQVLPIVALVLFE